MTTTRRGNKMKFAEILGVFAALVLSIGNVMAVPSGKTLEFVGSRGKVTFDGKVHADKGLKCANCHIKPKLFEMKKGGEKITMAAMNEGKFCGTCHDGEKAFSVKTQADCVKCHKADGAGDKADAKAPVRTEDENKLPEDKSTASTLKGETTGENAADAVITAKVKAAVLKEAALKSAEIKVETANGVVQLTGFAKSLADINKTAKLAKRVKGVKSVKNDLILKGTQ